MRTLAEHFRTIDALHALATEYPLLPAPDFRAVSDAPGDLMISCTESLSDFEMWREALRIDPASVEEETTKLGQIHLIAEAAFAGATVLLHGYSPRARQQTAQVA